MTKIPIDIGSAAVARALREDPELRRRVNGSAPAAPAPEPPQPEPVPEPDEKQVEKRLKAIRVYERAAELNHEDKLRRRFKLPPSGATLAEDLLKPRVPPVFTVEGLHRRGHNNVTAAQFKVGKTTVEMNLVRCMVDGELFLGKFEVLAPRGRVGYLNYELDQDEFEDWAIAMKIDNAERVSVWHLRGYHLPLNIEFVRDCVIQWCIDHEVTCLFIDTFRQAYTGPLEDAAGYTEAVDYIKREAAVDDTFTTAHVGVTARPGEERAMGGELNAWGDNLWTFTKDGQEVRYFSALGRSVKHQEEAALRWDEKTLSLELVGGSRREAKTDATEALAWSLISRALAEESGLSQKKLKAACAGHGVGNDKLDYYIDKFVRQGKVRQEDVSVGKRRAYAYSLA